jgi:MYXO-CTERM domain-containing protein
MASPSAEDAADLRPEARTFLRKLQLNKPELPAVWTTATTLPKTIRVWRRSMGGSDSCSGQVDVIPLEDYVKGVLPHEWIPSWMEESLKAGSVAIRTYAAAWVAKGGKYSCADLCDTTYSQVYKDSTLPNTNQAVDATSGQVLVTSGGSLVFAEYSAENGDPTKFGVSDPVCAGKQLNGHGRGMCQWGSQRWASQGKDYKWIALHYYPGASLYGGPTPEPDMGPPPPDAGSPPTQDATRPPDGGGAPRLDGTTPPQNPGRRSGSLLGGCSMEGTSAPESRTGVVLALLLLAALVPRRRRG